MATATLARSLPDDPAQTGSLTVTLSQLAKMIDHSLLHPTMTDDDILAGLDIAKRYRVATACVKPYLIPLARKELEGTGVLVCPVIGFPHGNSTTRNKVIEAEEAAEAGGMEVDMVINIGKALGGDWDYVTEEVRLINEAVTRRGAILKICSDLNVAFVKTSTGYGFVKQPDGSYNYRGATVAHLKLMRKHSKSSVQIKGAGGIRTLDDLLHVMSLGVTRVGATATVQKLEETRKRGITEEPTTVSFRLIEKAQTGSY